MQGQLLVAGRKSLTRVPTGTVSQGRLANVDQPMSDHDHV